MAPRGIRGTVEALHTRTQAVDRIDYYVRLRDLKLVGGGFAPFEELSADIYVHLGHTHPDVPEDVNATAAEIKARLDKIDWMPFEFRQVLKGKNHLDDRKFNRNVFRQEGGPLGRGAFREHIFGGHSLVAVIGFLVREKIKYGVPALRLKKWYQGHAGPLAVLAHPVKLGGALSAQ